ncbi:MAG: FapA family protein [Defluviitaleaceae bacterium]|nr:FapA family protein [Defluviitaleaceae bacterium]MCL2835730.1 FapA family protein [Defluviitaleaceae bacterium]
MLGNAEKGIYIDIRDDGCYLILDNRVAKDSNVKKNPMILFEHTNITDIDPDILKEAFNKTEERVEVKISNNTAVSVKDEDISIEVSKDAMEAKVTFIKGNTWFGNLLSLTDMIETIKRFGVVHGILTDVISALQSNRPPDGASVQIAVGRPAVHGESGVLKYNFDIDKQGSKPKLLDNGSVDYKNVDVILKARAGDVLVEALDAQPGIDGVNVRGQKVPHKPGKIAPRLPRGKNTTISADERQLTSDIDGQIQINSGRVDVLPSLIIQGDVGYTTGNIDFTGSVQIEGTILTGFSVKATENVEVFAALEGANIEAGGNVSLIGGVKGVGKSIIKAGGDIFARYVERATLIAGGDITSDSIMHSDIQCGGHLTVEGKKGLLVGGTIYAGKSVTAKVIGSSMATATDITAGSSPDHIIRYNELEEQYKKIKDDYDKERLVEAYKAANEDLKLRSLHARIHLRVEMDKIQKEMNSLLVALNSKEGIVRVSQVINCGVKIIVGGVLLKVQDELYSCTLRNKDEAVSIGAYIAY